MIVSIRTRPPGCLRDAAAGIRLAARFSRALSAKLRSLREQRGIALVMAIGTLSVVTIAGTTMIIYTTSNTRTANESAGNEVTFALSEAALNDALAVLANPANDPLEPTLLPATEATASSASYDTGTAKWWGVLDRGTAVWSIWALGLTTNPAGPGAAPVRRMLTAKVSVTAAIVQPLQNPAWNYVMSTQVTGGTCDMTLADGLNTGNPLTVTASLYVFGNLCVGTSIGGHATVTGGPLTVLGKMTIQDSSSSIGTSSASINEAHVNLGCKYMNAPVHDPCLFGAGSSAKDNVWATTIDSNPTVLTAPTADFEGWYEAAIPGPSQSCTAASGTIPTFDTDYPNDNNSLGIFDLTPTSSYTCRVGPGASSTLSGAMTTTQTALSVASAAGFPLSGFRIRIDDELMNVTAGFGTTSWTVTRGVNGTAAAPHVLNQTVQWDVSPSGEISWNALTKRLIVNGTIYIDGSAKIGNGALNTYIGQGSLYLSGTFLVSSGSMLCAVVAGSNCNFAGWDPNTKLFTVVANGTGGQDPAGVSVHMINASWQGAVFGTGKVRFEGSSNIQGPSVGSEVELGYNVSSGTAYGFGAISSSPVGMPSNPIVRAHTNPPQFFAG